MGHNQTVPDTVIVVPVRGGGKSRLEHPQRDELARAMALDTIEAALAVAKVIVVTDETMRADVVSLGARAVLDPGQGLNAAIEFALAGVSTGSTRSVLLGDVPGLDSAELAEALEAASAHDRAFVADADGTGTVLLVAKGTHALRFGFNSRQAHLDEGYFELVDPWPTLRRDIDLPEHLAALTRGRRTLELLHPSPPAR